MNRPDGCPLTRRAAPPFSLGPGALRLEPERRGFLAVPDRGEPSLERSQATRSPAGANADARHVVVDTDLAFDDIMALLYLLRQDDVVIDAVTIAGTGEAPCDPGVRNAIRLLALGGETDAPVACGRETPLQGTNAFPEEWRGGGGDPPRLGPAQGGGGGG